MKLTLTKIKSLKRAAKKASQVARAGVESNQDRLGFLSVERRLREQDRSGQIFSGDSGKRSRRVTAP